MYSGKKNRWMKHLDFMLIDIVSICVALFLAYGFRHGFHSVYARWTSGSCFSGTAIRM